MKLTNKIHVLMMLSPFMAAAAPSVDEYGIKKLDTTISLFAETKISKAIAPKAQAALSVGYDWPVQEWQTVQVCTVREGEAPQIAVPKNSSAAASSLKSNVAGQIPAPTPNVLGNCISWEDMEVAIPYGVAHVYPGADQVIDRPVVVVQPYKFDAKNPDDKSYPKEVFYSEVDASGMLTSLRNQGYDVILYNYSNQDAGAARNAKGLNLLLQRLNEDLNVKSTSVVGLSFGGVVARYALTQSERAGTLGKVATYISFDAPYQGANVPRSVRENILRMLDKIDIPGCRRTGGCDQARDRLEAFQRQFYTKTFQELVIDNPDGDANRKALQTELRNLGHIQTLPTLAIVNGSATRTQGQPSAVMTADFKIDRPFPYKNAFFQVWTNPLIDDTAGSYADFYGNLSKEIKAMASGSVSIFTAKGQKHSFVSTQSAIDGSTANFTEVLMAPEYASEAHMQLTYEKSRKIVDWLIKYQK